MLFRSSETGPQGWDGIVDRVEGYRRDFSNHLKLGGELKGGPVLAIKEELVSIIRPSEVGHAEPERSMGSIGARKIAQPKEKSIRPSLKGNAGSEGIGRGEDGQRVWSVQGVTKVCGEGCARLVHRRGARIIQAHRGLKMEVPIAFAPDFGKGFSKNDLVPELAIVDGD